MNDLLKKAIEFSIDNEEISATNLQKYLKISYVESCKLIDNMENLGIVSEYNGSKPRKILIEKKIEKETKKQDIDILEIIRLAFLKYKLSGRRSMNTFIFTQAKNNKLTDEQIDYILEDLEKKIKKYTKQQEKHAECEKVNFTCNVF